MQARAEDPKDALGKLDVPDRIVLYIDDLDRCTHKQVYDVLQAVHLLLALQSFVVVVGVDIRWIEGAIANHFEADPYASHFRENERFFDASAAANEAERSASRQIGERRTRSLEYLEKIFQIPFWLRSIESTHGGTYSRFVEYLLTDNKPIVEIPIRSTNDLTDRGELSTTYDTLPGNRGVTDLLSVSTLDVDSSNRRELTAGPDTIARVTLTRREYELLQAPEIGRLVGKSPRAVKRFVNIYRIIRARRRGSELAQFLGNEEGPPLFPAAILLLALEIGQASTAARSFRTFILNSKASTFQEAVNLSLSAAPNEEKPSHPADWLATEFGILNLDRAMEIIRAEKADSLSTVTWIALSDEVRRYSFNDPRN
jgi:hypothetical protein